MLEKMWSNPTAGGIANLYNYHAHQHGSSSGRQKPNKKASYFLWQAEGHRKFRVWASTVPNSLGKYNEEKHIVHDTHIYKQ